MKDTGSLIDQPDLTKNKMWGVVMQTVEPDSTIEATKIVVKILNSAYGNYYLDKVAADSDQIDKNKCKKLLSLLKDVWRNPGKMGH